MSVTLESGYEIKNLSGMTANARLAHAREILSGHAKFPTEADALDYGIIIMDMLTVDERKRFQENIQKALSSPQLTGTYGRIDILDELCSIYLDIYRIASDLAGIADVQQDASKIQGGIVWIRAGGMANVGRLGAPMENSIVRDIVIPFFSHSDVKISSTEMDIALWARTQDEKLREQMGVALSTDAWQTDKFVKNSILLHASINQNRYLTGAVRRIANLVKSALPARTSEMTKFYDLSSESTGAVLHANDLLLSSTTPQASSAASSLLTDSHAPPRVSSAASPLVAPSRPLPTQTVFTSVGSTPGVNLQSDVGRVSAINTSILGSNVGRASAINTPRIGSDVGRVSSTNVPIPREYSFQTPLSELSSELYPLLRLFLVEGDNWEANVTDQDRKLVTGPDQPRSLSDNPKLQYNELPLNDHQVWELTEGTVSDLPDPATFEQARQSVLQQFMSDDLRKIGVQNIPSSGYVWVSRQEGKLVDSWISQIKPQDFDTLTRILYNVEFPRGTGERKQEIFYSAQPFASSSEAVAPVRSDPQNNTNLKRLIDKALQIPKAELDDEEAWLIENVQGQLNEPVSDDMFRAYSANLNGLLDAHPPKLGAGTRFEPLK